MTGNVPTFMSGGTIYLNKQLVLSIIEDIWKEMQAPDELMPGFRGSKLRDGAGSTCPEPPSLIGALLVDGLTTLYKLSRPSQFQTSFKATKKRPRTKTRKLRFL